MSSDAPPSTPIVPERQPALQWNPLAVWALVGLALSVVAHVLSYAGIAAQTTVPYVWALHVGIFPPFFVLVLRLQRWRTPGARWSSQMRWGDLLRFFPKWVTPLVIGMFIYALPNFLWATQHLPGHGRPPAIGDGGAHETAVYTMRAFSGHWLVFYLVCALFFLYAPSDAEPRSARS